LQLPAARLGEVSMNLVERAWRITHDFTSALPRAQLALVASGDWNPLSPQGFRQLGEVVVDELALTGITASSTRRPTLQRTVDSCGGAAEELSRLGVKGAHENPEPLRVKGIRRRRFGPQEFERLTFEHCPSLPPSLQAEGLGGPATAVVHLCRAGDSPRPWIVWVHGAGQGRPLDLLFSRARRLQNELGMNVALPVQPGCGVRRDAWPPYPTFDPVANVAAVMRAVSEVRSLLRWLRPQSTAIAMSGLSMGSPVAALVSHLEQVDGVAVFTPILGPNATIAQHLGRWGQPMRDTRELLQSDAASDLASAIDYLSVQPSAPPDRRLIVGARHDRMAMREPALALHERWGGQLYWHDGSHVGQVFSSGVRKTTEQFLRAVAAER
jgi:pimeloyl-ACP methyl ester carboxylesterase